MVYDSFEMSVANPLVYHICVAGTPDPDFSDYVRGMSISTEMDRLNHTVTTLDGECPDHSALVGILSTLGNLHLPIIWMECWSVPTTMPPDSC
ncbi:MAG: hypothetical protein U0822_08885 [Anaerolineae bacterium]